MCSYPVRKSDVIVPFYVITRCWVSDEMCLMVFPRYTMFAHCIRIMQGGLVDIGKSPRRIFMNGGVSLCIEQGPCMIYGLQMQTFKCRPTSVLGRVTCLKFTPIVKHMTMIQFHKTVQQKILLSTFLCQAKNEWVTTCNNVTFMDFWLVTSFCSTRFVCA